MLEGFKGCPVSCRLTTKGNLLKGIRIEGRKFIKYYGFDPETKRLNFRLFLDEDQREFASLFVFLLSGWYCGMLLVVFLFGFFWGVLGTVLCTFWYCVA